MSLFDILAKSGQIKEMVERFKRSLKEEYVEGSAGGGMVVVRMNGAMEIASVKVDPEVLADCDAEMLGDLIAAAVSQAVDRAKDLFGKKFGEMGLGVDPSMLMG